MNRSLALKFQSGGELSIVTDEVVEGFRLVCQSALLNLLSEAGRDPIYSDRGTDLFSRALSGSVFDLRSASHECNFAASETLHFSRYVETADEADCLNAVQLKPVFVGLQRMDAEVGFESLDGRTFSYFLQSPS